MSKVAGLLRSVRLAPRQVGSLPWRADDKPSNSTAGRGRGRGAAPAGDRAANLFQTPSSRPFGKKDSIADELLDIVSTWKPEDESKLKPPPAPSTSKDTVSEEEVQRLLGTFFSTEPKSSEDSIFDTIRATSKQDSDSDSHSHDFEPPPPAESDSELEVAGDVDPSQFTDLQYHPRDVLAYLNSVQGRTELGKFLGLSSIPQVHWMVSHSPDAEKQHQSEDTIDLGQLNKEKIARANISKDEAQLLLETHNYSFTQEDDALRELLTGIVTNEEDPKETKYARQLDVHVKRAQEQLEQMQENIRQQAATRGTRHGKAIRESVLSIDQLYEENQPKLDECFAQAIQRKSASDPNFASSYQRLTQEWNQLESDIDRLTGEFGPDHELTLQAKKRLHRSRVSLARTFTSADFQGVDLPVFQEDLQADLPIHPRYQGPDGVANLHQDFASGNLQFLSEEEITRKLPNDYRSYFDALEDAMATPDELDRAWARTQVLNSHPQHLVKEINRTAVDSIDWDNIHRAVQADLPSTVGEFLGNVSMIAEDEHQSELFRSQLEHYMAVQLTGGLRDIKQEMEEFHETAVAMDKIQLKRKRSWARWSAARERSRVKAISEGKLQPPQKSIVVRAMESKGVVDEEDILDQALEILRRQGKTFTHKDIPAIRQQHFREKFKAIFHNGSFDSMTKAKTVAEAISNFIISEDELRIMAGALEMMSRQPTELELQEKRAERQREKLTVNYEHTTVSFGDDDVSQSVVVAEEGEQVLDGYTTGDFETDSDAPVSEPIPADFTRLSKFKRNASLAAEWAMAVDLPLNAVKGEDADFSKIAAELDKQIAAEESDSDKERP